MADDEEPVDPKIQIEEDCKPLCDKFWKEYEECAERIEKSGEGHCTGQYFEFYECVDKCAAPKIFKAIK